MEVARLSRIGQEWRVKKLTRRRREEADAAYNNDCDSVGGIRKGRDRLGTGRGGEGTAAQDMKEEGEVTREGPGSGKPEHNRDNADHVGEGVRYAEDECFLVAGTWLGRWQAYVLSGVFEVLRKRVDAPRILREDCALYCSTYVRTCFWPNVSEGEREKVAYCFPTFC